MDERQYTVLRNLVLQEIITLKEKMIELENIYVELCPKKSILKRNNHLNNLENKENEKDVVKGFSKEELNMIADKKNRDKDTFKDLNINISKLS